MKNISDCFNTIQISRITVSSSEFESRVNRETRFTLKTTNIEYADDSQQTERVFPNNLQVKKESNTLDLSNATIHFYT